MFNVDIETIKKHFLPFGVPNNVYKFRKIDPQLLSSLSEGYFWCSKPSEFNDPFDCYKHFLTFEPTVEDIVELFKTVSKTQGQQLKDHIDYFTKHPEEVSRAYYSIVEQTIESQGICCFANNYENNLLWSHYGDHHKGVCLAFQPDMDLESFLTFKVRYAKGIVPENYFANGGLGAIFTLTTKSLDWEYEDEYRVITDSPGKRHFKKEALTTIIFGCTTTEQEMLSVINVVENSGYKNMAYGQAYTLPNSFKLAFKVVIPGPH